MMASKNKSMSQRSAGRARIKTRRANVIRFPAMTGKAVEFVEVFNDTDFHSISIRFSDKTELAFIIDPEPGFTIEQCYSGWKTGDERILRRWPTIRSWD